MLADAELNEVIEAAVRHATHQAIVRRVAHLRDDVIDVALLAVAKARNAYDSEQGKFAAFAYWHYRGAVGRFIKREQRRVREEVPFLDHAPEPHEGDPMAALSGIAERYADEVVNELIASEAASAEPILLRREYHERVARLVAGLSPDDQRLLRLRFVEDEPWPAIAKVLEVPVHVVRYRAEKLAKTLRSALNRREGVKKPSARTGKKKPGS
jgi:RNA polymerase sigma factor (sigma-70 family)